jgi:hypothetical protein
MLPVYQDVQKLKQEGKNDEAVALYKSLSPEDQEYYKKVKEQVDNLNKAENGEQPEFGSDSYTEQSLVKTVTTYAKAIGVDPVTAFNRIFTGQKIRYVANGAVIVERLPLSESQQIKAGSGESMSDFKLDHIIPLQLGGSNSESNLKMVPNEIFSTYTPVENAIGKALRDNKIEKKEAQSLIKRFKDGEITKDEVMNALN